MPHPKSQSAFRIEGDVAYVELSKGRGTFIIDAAEVERVCATGWDLGTKGYVIRTDYSTGRKRTVRLHRWLVGLEHGDRRQADHVNGNPLDCRMTNLRIVPPAGNAQNRAVNRTSASGHRGVYRRKDQAHRLKPWAAHIRVNGRQRIVGAFATKAEAIACVEGARRALMPFSVER